MAESLTPNLRVIGRYSILRELRRDRHSVSYAAVDPVMNRELVVKAVQLVPAGPPISTDVRRRIEQAFVRQAQAAGRLHHPHIITVFDAGLTHEFGFLVIERVAGRPLHELIAGGLRPAFVQCASIAARVADALEYAHMQGVSHGRLGPAQVFLLADGSPKVGGFGGWIDDGASGDEALAHTHERLPYFQNEVTDETRRQDIRAVAQLLYMLLAGRAPPAVNGGDGESRPQRADIRSERPDTPAPLAKLVDETLDPRSVYAPRTAGALRDALTSFVWNARTANIAPSTLGIPLAAPPLVAPPTEPAPVAPVAPAVELRTTGTPASASVRAPTPAPAAPPPAAGNGRTSFDAAMDGARALAEQLRPWAVRYQLPLTAGGSLLALGLILGVVLGNLRHPESSGTGATVGSAAVADQARDPAAPAAPAVSRERGTGTVRFDILPWGEVFVDGKATGVAPPLAQLDLPAGAHRIEVRHGEAAVWQAQVDVRAGQPVTVSHRFE